MKDAKDIYLLLEDGTYFPGKSFGYFGNSSGEVVFATGMTGYTEYLTDPSYRGQILVSTYPLVGNYGVPDETKKNNEIEMFTESSEIQVRALIVSEYCDDPSHWNNAQTLSEWMEKQEIPGIFGIDTRALTKKLREKGVMLGKIVTKKQKDIGTFEDPNLTNLVDEVSIKEPKLYTPEGKVKKRVVVYDFGIKNNIIRSFLSRGIEVYRVPWDFDITSITTSEFAYDGVFFSPGPGDPKMIQEVSSKNIKYCIKNNIPTFGICLGNQLVALAIGGDTFKMKYGHRSVNQPCIDVTTGRCYITSQNHGFAVDSKSIPKDWKLWMENANDGTCEGMMHMSGKFFTVQYHPEACPGPTDTNFLFDKFLEIM